MAGFRVCLNYGCYYLFSSSSTQLRFICCALLSSVKPCSVGHGASVKDGDHAFCNLSRLYGCNTSRDLVINSRREMYSMFE